MDPLRRRRFARPAPGDAEYVSRTRNIRVASEEVVVVPAVSNIFFTILH